MRIFRKRMNIVSTYFEERNLMFVSGVGWVDGGGHERKVVVAA